MARIVGDDTGSEGPNHRSQGPVLLLHGHTRDGLSWFEGWSDGAERTLPAQLYDAGYDVFIANTRGTPNSREHVDPEKDPDDYENGGAQAYWDFDDTTIGLYDIPAFVNGILVMRSGDGEPCQKVQIITYSSGTMSSLVAASVYPETAHAVLGGLQLQGVCIYTDTNTLATNLGLLTG